MSEATELLATVEAVTQALARLGVEYFITGSLASSVHGEFRATNDLDIVAALSPDLLTPLFDALSRDFVADIDQAREALQTMTSFNLIHRGTYLKVDIFPCVSAFDHEAVRRAGTVSLPGVATAVRVATREDILLAKLRWFRNGGDASAVQWRDARRLVALNTGELDEPYLRAWATRLGVLDLLALVLEQP